MNGNDLKQTSGNLGSHALHSELPLSRNWHNFIQGMEIQSWISEFLESQKSGKWSNC